MFPIKGVSDVVYYDKDTFKDRFNVNVEDFIEFKALMGDEGDNIAGVPGVGQKTAALLINKFGNIENLMLNLDSEQSIRGWKRISNNISKWDHEKTLKLVTIVKNCPINHTFEDCKVNLNFFVAICFCIP